MLSPKDREKLIAEEAEKTAGGGSAASARKLQVNPSPSGEPETAQWEVIPNRQAKILCSCDAESCTSKS